MEYAGDLVEVYDDLVIGAGSSGAVIASRLSEDSARRVLLVEAGPAYAASDELPPPLRQGNQPAAVDGMSWEIQAEIKNTRRELPGSPPRRGDPGTYSYEAGRVLGGSSAINAVQALRGTPDDFTEWACASGGAWSWADVLPYYRKLETDPIGSERLHGRDGPIPITRESRESLTRLPAALMDVCLALGHPESFDHNDPDTTGVGVIPKNVVGGVRMSTALTYLAAARSRSNLRILSRAHVHRLTFDREHHCTGAIAAVGSRLRRLAARRVILCAGAFQTPAILLRSGIGDPTVLRRLAVETVLPLAGVGRNFMDHPVVGIWAVPKPDVSAVGDPLRQTLSRYSSGTTRSRNDMHVCVMAGMDVRILPARIRETVRSPVIAGVTVSLMKSRSKGRVTILSADPDAQPYVQIGCLSDRSDLPPLIEGVRLAWQIVQASPLRTQLAKILAWTDGMLRSSSALEQAVATFVRPSAHGCGTAAMGPSADDGAVVDARCRVHGADNLWIADASIMPVIPSAPTNLTCIMIGEKVAAELRGHVAQSGAASCS